MPYSCIHDICSYRNIIMHVYTHTHGSSAAHPSKHSKYIAPEDLLSAYPGSAYPSQFDSSDNINSKLYNSSERGG